MDIQSAVDAPRFHHQWKPENIYMEKDLASDSLSEKLVKMGHKPKIRGNIGHVNAIMYNEQTLSIGADKRGDNYGEIINK